MTREPKVAVRPEKKQPINKGEAMATQNTPELLAALGITREEVLEKVVERLTKSFLTNTGADDEGEECTYPSAISRKVEANVKDAIDKAVTAFGEKHVLPSITAYIDTYSLQKTNEWGEKKGGPVTFAEYLVKRAEAFMQEPVNHRGEPQGSSSYGPGWTKMGSRIAYMIDQHLLFSMQSFATDALKTANSQIAGGIEAGVKTALSNVLTNIKVTTETKAK